MKLEPFALLDLPRTPLDRTVLVEANAGTGKTWAITGLYLRLVAERGLKPEQILAVTYTKAAMAELRQRLRSRLEEALEFLRGAGPGDEFLAGWAATLGDRGIARGHIEHALQNFDRASISTIHAFCQDLLADLAFECGVPFDVDVLADERDLMLESVDDFWREKTSGIDPFLIEWLVTEGVTPDSLRKAVAPFVHKEYLEWVDGLPAEADLASLGADFSQKSIAAREVWAGTDSSAVKGVLLGGALNGTVFSDATVTRGLESAATLFGGGALSPPALFSDLNGRKVKDLERLGRRLITGKTRKGKRSPTHPLFDAVQEVLDALEPLRTGAEAAATRLRHDLITWLRKDLPLRKEDRRLKSYDDLLLDVWRALRDTDKKDTLLDGARKKYQAALVDEFQDTDPVQGEIFRRIFADAGLPLFMVGDPKQAIYAFRGADVFAYLQARRDAAEQFGLRINRRSAPGLVSAVNTLFGGGNPFLLASGTGPLIPHNASQAVDTPPRSLAAPEDRAPLRFWHLPPELSNVDDIGAAVAAATANEIVVLLKRAREGKLMLVDSMEGKGPRRFEGRDIAVLVRTGRQGTLVRRELARRGVAAAQHSQDDVFSSDECRELRLVLEAVTKPSDRGRVTAALATRMLGLDGAALDRLRHGDALAGEMRLFRDDQERWLRDGFLPMFRRMLRERGVAGRILAEQGGERRLTNLLHLGELLHQAAHDGSLGPETLVLWLVRRSAEKRTEEEGAALLRLESDDDLVKIVTVHAAKGLQYPVVFLPFGWFRRAPDEDEDLLIHDPASPHDARLVMGVPKDAGDPNRSRAEAEGLAEEMRLLYVALTRAQCRCYAAWARAQNTGRSALASILAMPADRGEDGAKLKELAAKSGGAIVVEEIPEDSGWLARPSTDTDGWAALPFVRGRLHASWRHASYSGLTAGAHASRDDDAPDHDEAAPVPTEPMPGETLPAGAEIGTCLHTIFERWDPGKEETLRPITERALEGAGIDPKHTQAAVDLIIRAVGTPLFDGGPTLEKVPKAHRLEEMEFWFPVASLDPARLKRALDTGHLATAFREQVGRLDFNAVHGFMKGFVDLVFEHAGKWYVCDYKSNRLADYTPERIDETMARSLYFVQYLLYTVALHRYLRLRLPRYDYDTHIGGVAYLFLRGMRPDRPGSGVFCDRPARELVETLDACMGETT